MSIYIVNLKYSASTVIRTLDFLNSMSDCSIRVFWLLVYISVCSIGVVDYNFVYKWMGFTYPLICGASGTKVFG